MIKITELKQIYKCAICGNIVEVLHNGAGELVCCGQPMELIEEKTDLNEKHTPVMNNGEIRIGQILHPMEAEHYIEWIEVVTEKTVLRKNLKPGDEPKAVLNTDERIKEIRAYCNQHGLWKKVY